MHMSWLSCNKSVRFCSKSFTVKFPLVQLGGLSFDTGSFEVNRFPSSFNLVASRLNSAYFSKLREALSDSSLEVGKKGCWRKRKGVSAIFASVGTRTNQTFVLNFTSVSRCCFMIAFAIGPIPDPRTYANLTLLLSPYKT